MTTIRRTSVAALGVIVLLLSACGEPGSDELIASAKSSLAKNDGKTAVIQLKGALQQTPDSAAARFLLGKALFDVGDPIGATVELRRALDLKYSANEALPLLVKALVLTRQFKLVVQQYAATELPEPTANAALKTAIADAYAAQGLIAKADEALAAALKSAPNYPQALIFQARRKAELRQLDEAFAIIDRVTRANPGEGEAWQMKGNLLLFFKSDAAGASAAYAQAIKLKPDDVAARSSLISLLLAQRDLPAAQAQIDELRKTLPKHPQTRYFDAHLAYAKGENDKARDLLQQLLKFAPDNVKLLQLAGAVAFNSNSLLQAETQLTRALQLQPDLPAARLLLAKTHMRAGQPTKALVALKPMLTASPPEAEAFSVAGQAFLQTGDLKQAEAQFTQAAKLNPKDAKSRTALAVTRMTASNADATLAEFRSISAEDSGTSADYALLSAQLRKKDLDGALKSIDAIEKKEPKSAMAPNLRGEVWLLFRKDTAKARAGFEQALAVDPTFIPAAASLANLDIADNKPDAAKKRFEAVLAADPKNMKALFAVAGLRARAGASKEEIAGLLLNAAKLNPTEVAPRLMLIDHYLSNKDVKQALTEAQTATAALPESPDLLDAVGRAQLAAGDANQAINSFKRMAALAPESAIPPLRLAGAYMAGNDTSAANQSLRRALELQRDLLVAQQLLIELELAAKRPDDALQVARMVQRQRPGEAVGFVLEGNIESSRRQYAVAAEAYRTALRKLPDSETATRLHSALGLQGKDAEADALAQTWLKDKPDDAAFLFYLGEISLGRNKLAEAETYFQRVLALKPDSPSALNNMAWLLLRLNKPGALALAEKANKLRPDTAAFMDTLAVALAGERQFDRAIEIEKKAMLLAPNSPSLRLNLARIYVQAGNKPAARTELEVLAKLARKFPAHAEVTQLLGSL